MQIPKRRAPVLLALVLGLVPAATVATPAEARPPAMTVTVLGGTETNFAPSRINDRAQVLGTRPVGGGRQLALYDRGGFTAILAPLRAGYVFQSLWLNQRGDVAGTTARLDPIADPAYSELRPFLWSRGRLVDLGVTDLAVTGLDDSARLLLQPVVRFGAVATAKVWDDGEVIELPPLPEGHMFTASTISATGLVGGSLVGPVDGEECQGFVCLPRRPRQAALWRPGGAVISLGTLGGGTTAMVNHITPRGIAVGSARDASGAFRTFVARPGDSALTDIGTPDPAFTSASPIQVNRRGQALVITGEQYYRWTDGAWEAVGPLTRYRATAMNDRGEVLLGDTSASAPAQSLLWREGRFIDFIAATGTGPGSFGTALNSRGDLLGARPAPFDGVPGYHALVWTVRR